MKRTIVCYRLTFATSQIGGSMSASINGEPKPPTALGVLTRRAARNFPGTKFDIVPTNHRQLCLIVKFGQSVVVLLPNGTEWFVPRANGHRPVPIKNLEDLRQYLVSLRAS